jgi:hypothetical protein
MSRTIDLMARHLAAAVAFTDVLCVGRFTSREEAIFSDLESQLLLPAHPLEVPSEAALIADMLS